MITPKHAWLIFAVISEGMHWPSPEDSGEPLAFARLPGRWIGENEFETTDGDVLLIPPISPEGKRKGMIEWRDSPISDSAGA